MVEDPMVKSADTSAYGLEVEMSLLLSSSAPAPWGAAVHEAARLLVDQEWERNSPASVDLGTLSLLLFARTHSGDRAPGDVPIAELREALYDPGDREPQIVDEIDRALTDTGQGYSSTALRDAPLLTIFNPLRSRYGGRLGASMLADDIEPPLPGPSLMRAAAARLARLFANSPAQDHEQATGPVVAPGPLIIECDRIQIVSRSSLRPLRCRQTDHVRAVHVDGPEVIQECDKGHTSTDWQLDVARVRMAVARATGAHPAAQGRHQFQELLVASPDLPRHSDPRQANAFLSEPPYPIVGRDDIYEQIERLSGNQS
ncbi:hypothetical protein ACFVZM_10075 [Streptomyces sioyaensis]|uniref:hypothetical protein n=1 Tax=Streptomyces sioyaensis TaxID=67364 RepID=UPI0036B6585D